MFDQRVSPQVAGPSLVDDAARLDNAAGLDDAAVIDALGVAARAENAAAARRLAWMGELYARRAPNDDVDRINWAIDGQANVVAEISAALRISRGRAGAQLRYGIALRERLPKVAEVFGRGAIDYPMMVALVARSDIVDGEVIAKLDAVFAKHAPNWMRMSGPKLTERIDMWVEKFDPEGVREPRAPREDRFLEIGPTSAGMAGIWGQLEMTEGAALDRRLDELAGAVCGDDPRTTVQRRADALVALAGGQSRLACGCGAKDCPASGAVHQPLAQVVIHVLAEQATVAGASRAPGYLPGLGPVPAPLVRKLAESAKCTPVRIPPPVAEPGYRPSAALAEFIRWRDLTCRFPGCDQPAAVCHIDHTIPYPAGPTHPSNLKLYCPPHHLIKTFYTGVDGWTDRQLPDGTVIFTAPTGHTYLTTPAGALFFPALGTPTGQLAIPERTTAPTVQRALMMPRRTRTRTQDRAARISGERKRNAARINRKGFLLAERLARDDEPPPF
ncbi:HNH endonuclease signature motif containing protein [Mycobacterium decipiens]|uniref:HNH nuclease domain-containing protein n=1 Tax=Mycobacterium decipiens TaxID=1430326 RepID=A0A1X2LSW1_9MYCO|nr:HNH endonuclease signature motif containing protein [Mycobacterium decipiens]OSC39862.1 hypothetical protein B8W66_15300 [Mycobacterium decipiens]